MRRQNTLLENELKDMFLKCTLFICENKITIINVLQILGC